MDSDAWASSKDQVELTLLMAMLAIFSLVGFIGNGLVIFVFQRVREKTTAQVFMIFLAIIDLFTCTVIIPLTMFMEYTGFQIRYDFLCKIYHFLITSKIPLSAFIMVAIAVDRYFCICHPLKHAITIIRARIIIIGFTLVASVFGLMTSFLYGVHSIMERPDDKRLYEILGYNLTKFMLTMDHDQQQIDIIRKKVVEVVSKKNLTVEWEVNSSLPYVQEVYNSGFCYKSYLIFSEEVSRSYMTAYNAIFPTCLVVVVVLYMMIYRFMYLRRSRKLEQRLKMCAYVKHHEGASNGTTIPLRDDEQGLVTELSAVSHSPLISSRQSNYSNANAKDEETTARLLADATTTLPNNGGMQYLSPKSAHFARINNLSSSCSNLNAQAPNANTTATTTLIATTANDAYKETVLSSSNSCLQQGSVASGQHGPSPSSSPPVSCQNLIGGGGGSTKRNQIYHQEPNKCRWYKKRDSVKRYKGKKKGLRQSGERSLDRSKDYDPDRLREENRMANVKTALMLFMVNIVFAIAFGPAWLITLNVLDHNRVVFYLYFIYNVANPFIYAFMNHIFKSYMKNIFSCAQKALVSAST